VLVVGVGQRGCWHRGSRGSLEGRGGEERERAEEGGGGERGPKELAARNNGKSSVYLMASNHAILSSTAGLLPRCIRGAGVGSGTYNRP